MIKSFIVAGSNWNVAVDLSDVDNLNQEELKVEACTRAVERHLEKRTDLPYSQHDVIKLTKKQKQKDQLHATIIELLSEELKPGCGIGMLLCIIKNDGTPLKENEDNEWYISSKNILENVGRPDLVEVFNKKYPDKKQKTT